ncbi:hypothetical protein LAh9_121 [Aeromonas phage LAh_9]|uniref:TMhelix containing protein n=3 Tax=Lahexavirus TaxID=2843411 RepID=A0A514A128_9CAUD|nr:hypothetical protein HWC30_gp041 [Aeromonas phage LAh_6]YP_009847438.1 hypothetical protein HWC31_gp100 [Aeromonas phage LAh_8]YP_009847603.1 hypothetical protein HWC32_gp122 [Aeromonas phage LAh_9]QDH46606.1 hypothetical protein LAh6_41 [Aeromonas phage LAh_6]QDH46834.1 hypothetical protein LAh8_99 [Aeromonas phage LAh_8]QDH46977.1 hypothetical protein LAh9_121 [Aeromonas phage LAh_9]
MEIFGWICLVILATLSTIGLVAGFIIQSAFCGIKCSDVITLFVLSAIPAILWYVVVVNFPFTVMVK